MKNSIEKAPVYVVFSAFYADFCLCPKLVIITTLKQFGGKIYCDQSVSLWGPTKNQLILYLLLCMFLLLLKPGETSVLSEHVQSKLRVKGTSLLCIFSISIFAYGFRLDNETF